MIYLQPEVRSGLGEDTFWTWAAREFPAATFDAPSTTRAGDSVLQYSTLGAPVHRPGSIALCWELYAEMRLQFGSAEWDQIIRRTEECAAGCARIVVASEFARPFYEAFGSVDCLPIGVDCDLFQPRDRRAMRDKHGLPREIPVGLWMGTMHPMKGFDLLLAHVSENPATEWIVVWKDGRSRRIARRRFGDFGPHFHQYTAISQATLAELMVAADFFLSGSRLRPFFMVEWEAMACDLPIINAGQTLRDFEVTGSPRDEVLRRGWDRATAKNTWLQYLGG